MKTLKKMRDELGLERAQVAKRLKISIGFYSNVERGVKPVPIRRIKDFARVFKVNPSILFRMIGKWKEGLDEPEQDK